MHGLELAEEERTLDARLLAILPNLKVPFVAEAELYLKAPATRVIRVGRVEGVSELLMVSVAEALADASQGVVLSRIPVTMPHRYELLYQGKPRTLSWAEIAALG